MMQVVTPSISGTTGNPSNTGTNSQGSSATNATYHHTMLLRILSNTQGGETAKVKKNMG